MVKKISVKKEEAGSAAIDKTIEEMAAAGIHLGHRVSRLHPKMEKYVIGIKNTVHIINLEKTRERLQEALNFIETLVREGKEIMFVGTKPPLRGVVKEIAEACGAPYIVERWVGGVFTNFNVIAKRLEHLKELERKKAEGFFDQLSKKGKARKEKELAALEKKFGGIKNLGKIPEVVFICDLKKDHSCLKEAKRKGVKTVALVHTNVDPEMVDYPIPANDDAISSVRYVLEKIKETIQAVRSSGQERK